MMRFLPRSQIDNMLTQKGYGIFMVGLMQEFFILMMRGGHFVQWLVKWIVFKEISPA
jgi:hypothetical protein